MSLPTSEPLPPEEENLSPSRLRHRRRIFLPLGENKRATFLADLSHQATPSFDFFLFSLLAGLVLAIGILLDSPAVYILAVLIAPFMAPLVGSSLGVIIGSPRYFLQSLLAFLIGSILIFADGALVGLVSRSFPDLLFQQTTFHVYFTWADLVVVATGALLTPYFLARSPQSRPLLSSAALAYELYLPIGIAGFGLTRGLQEIWQGGTALFLLNLALAIFFGVLMLIFLGLRSKSMTGYALGTGIIIICLLGSAIISGKVSFITIPQVSPLALLEESSTPTDTETATYTPSMTQTQTYTFTPLPSRTATPPPTMTQTTTKTPTLTPSETEVVLPTPTPMWAVVHANEGNGALFRLQPSTDSELVPSPYSTLVNGTLVQVFETVQNQDGIWAHVRLPKGGGVDGWILRQLLSTVTPTPTR